MLRGLVTSVAVVLGACSAEDGARALDFHMVPADEVEILAPELLFADVRDIVVSEAAIWVLDLAPPFVTRISGAG